MEHYLNPTGLTQVVERISGSIKAVDDRVREIELFKFPNATIVGEPLIESGQVSRFSNTNYMIFPFVVDVRDKAFEIDFCFTTGANVTTQQNIIDSKCGIAFAIQNGSTILALSSNGSTFDIGAVTGTYTIEPNKTYYAKLEWTKSIYALSLSQDGRVYTMDIVVNSTLGPYPTSIYIGGSPDLFGAGTAHPLGGSINMNRCSLTVAGLPIWAGMDDAGISTRADVSLSNIDSAGEEKIISLARPLIPSLTKYLDKAYTGINELAGKIQVGSATTNVTNAFTHVRQTGSGSISGKTVNGAAFSVNGDGSASFQHKTYDANGSGAKNAAVFRFWGGDSSGIQFAVNSGTGATPSESDYRNLAFEDQIPNEVTESTVSGWGFTKNTGTYIKPSDGIPKADLASDIQTSLGKADTALQEHQDISGKATLATTDNQMYYWMGRWDDTHRTAMEVDGTNKNVAIVFGTGDNAGAMYLATKEDLQAAIGNAIAASY